MTKSPVETKSATSGRGWSSSRIAAMRALSDSTDSLRRYSNTATFRSAHSARKRSLILASSLFASPFSFPSTQIATSVVARTASVFFTRCAPSSPSSSSPAVSVSRHGPSGRISIAFETGSVVVPGFALTIASSWPVNALKSVDFPALRKPKNAICVRSPFGVSFIPAIIRSSRGNQSFSRRFSSSLFSTST